MKKIAFLIVGFIIILCVQCNAPKILTINSHLAVITATKTNTLVNRTSGAILSFVIETNATTTLDSVLYWGIQKSLQITATNEDTIWAQATFIKPIPERAIREGEQEQSMAAVAPPDTTCIITYHNKEEVYHIKIPSLHTIKE